MAYLSLFRVSLYFFALSSFYTYVFLILFFSIVANKWIHEVGNEGFHEIHSAHEDIDVFE